MKCKNFQFILTIDFYAYTIEYFITYINIRSNNIIYNQLYNLNILCLKRGVNKLSICNNN